MPYNPGVTDISGQLLAQGILGRAQAYSGGMDAISRGIQARKLKDEQDQALLAKAKSTETFIKAHSDIFGGDDAVKQLTATDPRESPVAKYARLTQAVQDTVVGKSLEREQQQSEQLKQQTAAAAFVQQQKQLQQQRDDAQRQRFEQLRTLINGGDPSAMPARQWPGSGTGPWAGQPGAGQPGAGPIGPNTPAIAAPGASPAAPQIDPATMQALQYYKMTGAVPNEQAAVAMMGNDTRQQVADERAKAAQQRLEDQLNSREAIASAQEETKRTKASMNEGSPRYHTDPETGLRSIFTGAQWQVLPGQVAKDPMFNDIDAMLAKGTITEKQANSAKMKLIAAKGVPKQDALQAILAQNNPQMAANLAMQQQKAVNGFWEVNPNANGSSAPQFDPSYEGKTVRGPDGKMYRVQNGNPVPIQ